MEKNKSIRLITGFFLLGVLLLLTWATYVVVSTVRQSAQQAQQVVQPVTDLSNSLGTQIAQILKPTPTVIVDPVTIVNRVRSLARLETIQYSLEKVITAEMGQGTFGFLFGDRLLLVAHGIVIAGVDLGKLQPSDLRLEYNVLYVHLPQSEIFITSLDNDKSYIYDRETGVLTKGDINLETTARRVAEQSLEQTALEDGILEQARQNAESYLYRLLMEIGNYSEVIFLPTTPQP